MFVCLGSEAHALTQAVQLRDVLPVTTPIVVRVQEETTGFGQLLGGEAGAFGPKLRVVGAHDRFFDVIASMNPMVEMLAQVLHQDFLHLRRQDLHQAASDAERQKILKKNTFRPWRHLSEHHKDINRRLAQRLEKHRTVPSVNGSKPRRYALRYVPGGVVDPTGTFVLSDAEHEVLARQEHELWHDDLIRHGWRCGSGDKSEADDPIRWMNNNLRPWDELDPDTRAYDFNIIRRMPHVFAKVDLEMVPLP